MANLAEKLNYKGQQQVVILGAPENIRPELALIPALHLHEHLESVTEVDFVLAFVKARCEVERLAPWVAAKAPGDAVVWFAYPKASSKRYPCDFNRDTGWDAMKALGYKTVRAIAIDDDWTGLRLRRTEFIKAASPPPPPAVGLTASRGTGT